METLSVRYHPNQDTQNTTVSNYTKVSVTAFSKGKCFIYFLLLSMPVQWRHEVKSENVSGKFEVTI